MLYSQETYGLRSSMREWMYPAPPPRASIINKIYLNIRNNDTPGKDKFIS